MKVKDLISRIFNRNVEIAVNEYNGDEHTGRRWIIPPRSNDCTHIPDDVWNSDVSMIVPYYERISIEIEA